MDALAEGPNEETPLSLWLTQLGLLSSLLSSAAAAVPGGSDGEGQGREVAALVRFALASVSEILLHLHRFSQQWVNHIGDEQVRALTDADVAFALEARKTPHLLYWIETSQLLLGLGPRWPLLLQLAGPGPLQREREVCSAPTLGALVAAMAAEVEGMWDEGWNTACEELAGLKAAATAAAGSRQARGLPFGEGDAPWMHGFGRCE